MLDSMVWGHGHSPAWHLPSRMALRRGALGLLGLAAVAAAELGGHRYWTVGRFLESTDDAYVKADYSTIAPKVSGYVLEVQVADNENVRAGQLLARIDDRDLRNALARAQADVAAGDAALENNAAQIALQRSVIDQERAAIAADQATLAFAREEQGRYGALLRAGYGSEQRAHQADTAAHTAAANLERDRAGLSGAEQKIGVLEAERSQARAQREHSVAVAQQQELELSYTEIRAPVAGTVGARSLRVGQYVEAGTPLMAIVPLRAVYVVANFKETQLANVRSGQPVEIAVDGFSGHRLRGRVDSVAPASGLEFALLPPDNATGNFTKIVQRIPVRIALDPESLDQDGFAGGLRAGMSVVLTIDTRETVLRKPSTAAKDVGSENPTARGGEVAR
jgi:membrane fusion protein (multidrug efflux system)